MDKHIFNEDNGLWYELAGDYYLPCLTVPAEEKQSVGVWGQRHKRYLKKYRPALYNALLLSGKLNAYLAGIDQQAQDLMDTIMQQMAEAQELSDLKDENMALEYELNRQKDLMARLMQRVEAALTFLEEKLPEQFRPYVQRARAHIMPEPKQEHRHDRGMSMGGMSR